MSNIVFTANISYKICNFLSWTSKSNLSSWLSSSSISSSGYPSTHPQIVWTVIKVVELLYVMLMSNLEYPPINVHVNLKWWLICDLFSISFFPLLWFLHLWTSSVRPTQKGWLPFTFVGLVAMPLMVPAAYHDGLAVQICDLAEDHVGVSSKRYSGNSDIAPWGLLTSQ